MVKRQKQGFSMRDIDRKVRPQDDFYQFANGGWLKRNKIPPAESRWGTFIMLRYKTEQQLRAILGSLEKGSVGPPGSPRRMIRDFARSGMDMKRRNKLGLSPLSPYLARIENISNTDELQETIAALHRLGVGVLWSAGVDQDAKNSEKYLLHLHQDGLAMPDRDYYLKTDAESTRVRTKYLPFVEGQFRLMGAKPSDAVRQATTVLQIETELARASMNKVDRREIEKTYHKKTPRELSRLVPEIDWKRYFTRIGAGTPAVVIVMQPEFLRKVGRMIHSVPLADWKTYLSYHLVNDSSYALSSTFLKHRFSFYGTTLAGVKVMKPLWRQVLAVVNGSLGELLGQLYVAKYFPPNAKQKANALVKDLFIVYEERIKMLDWMSPATKRKAVKKLRAMTHKIGYPSRWKSYRGLIIQPDDYFGNIVRSAEFTYRREMKKLAKRVDRNEWFMFPQTVNAYNAPTLNDIAFPAAILQSPFFDPNGDDAINYGAIGAVIGHEMTHGFDDEGAKFDAKGNWKRWWTPADRKRFEQKGRMLVAQYNQYEVVDGVKVNGKLTLGENIADLGGATIAYDAYQRKLSRDASKSPTGGDGRKTIRGFTPEQRYFLGFALFERELVRPEFEKTATLTDPHSPGQFRINGPLSNMEEFYEAFAVIEGDRLYRRPRERAKVW